MGMATGEDIKRAREAKGWSQSALAQKVGITQPAVKKIEDGLTLRSRYMADLERALGLAGDVAPMPEERVKPVRIRGRVLGERDLPVYTAAEGGPGLILVSTALLEVVERPWYLRDVEDGFGVLIVGESMEPVFEPGDIAIVNPHLPPMRNKNTIFTSGENAGEVDFRATVKRLVRWDTEHWYVRQFNAPRDFTLSREEWPAALRVVGKQEG